VPCDPGIGFEDLAARACGNFRVTTEELRSRERNQRVAAARSWLAARAAAELGLSGAEIGRRLGVSKAAVHLMLERARSNNLTS
jgi:chromosomal replication initiation ATPase DnaA